jgi:hypothetical protein
VDIVKRSEMEGNAMGFGVNEDDIDDFKIFNALFAEQVEISIIINENDTKVENHIHSKEKLRIKNEKGKKVKDIQSHNNNLLLSPQSTSPLPSLISSSSTSSTSSSASNTSSIHSSEPLVIGLSNLLHLMDICKQMNTCISFPFVNALLRFDILHILTNLLSMEFSQTFNLFPRAVCSGSLRVRKLVVDVVNSLAQINPLELKKFLLEEKVHFPFFLFFFFFFFLIFVCMLSLHILYSMRF